MRRLISKRRKLAAGNILLTVTFASFFSMALSAGLVSHLAVSEADEINYSLAKVRAYWAEMGAVDFVLSRARHIGTQVNGLCANAPTAGECDSPPVDAVLAPNAERLDLFTTSTLADNIFRDLENTEGSPANGMHARVRWTYPAKGTDTSNGYRFEIELTALELDVTPRAGKIRLIADLVTPNSGAGLDTIVPILTTFPAQVRDLQVEVCFLTEVTAPVVTARLDQTCIAATSPTAADSPITATLNGIDDANSNDGATRIVSVKRCFFDRGGDSTATNEDDCDHTP
mgnify:FL=1|jgi:hypothetical protein